MKVVYLIVIFFLNLAYSSMTAASQIEITFDGLKALLEKGNGKVEATRLEVEASKNRQGALFRSFMPSVELHGAQEFFKVGQQPQKNQPAYGAEMKINIFNGGQDQLQSKIRDMTTEKKKIQLTRVFSEELQKARSLFWDIIYSQEKIELIELTIKINGQNLASAKKRIQSGVATESDRFEFEMKSVDLKRDLDEAKLKLINQKKELSVVLNLDTSGEMRFPKNLAHEHNFEDILKHSPKDHEFLFKENEILASTLSLSAKSQGRVWWPKIDAYAAYNQFNERERDFSQASDRTETMVGLRMTLSLPAGLESNNEASALSREAEAYKKLAEFQRKEIETHVETELSELRLRHDQVHYAEENIQRAESYYKLTQSEYTRGVKNSPDVLGASDKLFEMKHRRLEIIRDFQISKTHVLAKIGR
jgi:outer membrane protein